MPENKTDLAFALNYTNLHMINITPGAAAPTWAYLGGGIQTINESSNETVDQTAYYDGGGQASSDITGAQTIYAYSGHRKYGDAAQDFIESLKYVYGEARKTDFKHIAPDGAIIEGRVTLANIVTTGGDANSKGTFSVEAQFNGAPTYTPGSFNDMPSSMSVTPVTVGVGETQKIVVTVDPVNASNACVYGVENDDIATVDADGNVRGIAPGETRVTVKSMLKPSLAAQVVVTVTGEAIEALPTIVAAGYAKDKATGDKELGVSDCVDQTFYIKFNKELGDKDYLIVQEVQGKKYGLIIEASKNPTWKKAYWTLTDGRQVDFVDGAKKASNNAAKVDLSSFSGAVNTTVYQLTGAWDGNTYPTDLVEIGQTTITVSNV